MRLTADTNILVRAAADDDPRQSPAARRLLSEVELIAVPVPVLCEFVWVMARGYGKPPAEIVRAIRSLIAAGPVRTDVPAVEAGLAFLEAGGDFADGVIAFQGRQLGAETFASFDRNALDLVRAGGGEAVEPS
ncbi:MAG TPA: type II toxin-antitoxin system VapC family toxin [Azospirillaceae bacterium]|nr:type II toxin-antitoxin system VapC family toxin [Azospirillaceae bacterium]